MVQVINSHPDPKTASHLQIQSVLYCIDQTRAFIKFNMTMPKLLDQCSQGLVNCIALTGSIEPQRTKDNKSKPSASDDGEKLQDLLRNVNNDVAFLLTPLGRISRSKDIDMILKPNAYEEPNLIKARYLLFPTWYVGKFKTSPSEPFMYEVSLKLQTPFEKHRVNETLKGLSSLENL